MKASSANDDNNFRSNERIYVAKHENEVLTRHFSLAFTRRYPMHDILMHKQHKPSRKQLASNLLVAALAFERAAEASLGVFCVEGPTLPVLCSLLLHE